MNNTKEYFLSDAKYLKIDLIFNLEGVAEEAKRLKERYYTHRDGDYDHKGWKSLTLHGLDENKTGHWKDYGYSSSLEAYQDMRWTDVAKECPNTMNFLMNNYPCNYFGRVRFMLLEANGHIGQHIDSRASILENTNISLINPKECTWQWGDGETLNMDSGNSYLMNIHNSHGVINNSNQDRFHLIIHRFDCTPQWKNLVNNACNKQNIKGTWVEAEVQI